MSTYLNPNKPGNRSDYSDCPQLVADYLHYLETIRGLSLRSVNAYYVDLRTFFKFLVQHRGLAAADTPLDQIIISQLDLGFIRKVSKGEIYDFLYYVTRERSNSAATRARKLSSLKGFFKYLTNRTGQLEKNPVDDVEMPAQKKRLPKYLNLNESVELLNNIQSDFYERDHCIITLFLNCGMRLSELVGLNITDVTGDKMRVIGKGNKERMVYLNAACLAALDNYRLEREKLPNLRDKKALFVSRKTGQRLTARRVQQIVNGCLNAAGLGGKGYSVHKLRHTAATLMYQHGHVDLLSLREILGHVDVSTTQIYTHLDTLQLREAAKASPLSNMAVPRPAPAGSEDDTDEDTETVDAETNSSKAAAEPNTEPDKD